MNLFSMSIACFYKVVQPTVNSFGWLAEVPFQQLRFVLVFIGHIELMFEIFEIILKCE